MSAAGVRVRDAGLLRDSFDENLKAYTPEEIWTFGLAIDVIGTLEGLSGKSRVLVAGGLRQLDQDVASHTWKEELKKAGARPEAFRGLRAEVPRHTPARAVNRRQADAGPSPIGAGTEQVPNTPPCQSRVRPSCPPQVRPEDVPHANRPGPGAARTRLGTAVPVRAGRGSACNSGPGASADDGRAELRLSRGCPARRRSRRGCPVPPSGTGHPACSLGLAVRADGGGVGLALGLGAGTVRRGRDGAAGP